MLRSLTTVLLVAALSCVVECGTQFIHGDRAEGDELLYIRTKITNPTEVPSMHALVFDWVGVNQTMTQVVIDTNGYDLALLDESREYVPPYYHRLVVSMIQIESRQLIASMTVYGFSGKTHVDLLPASYQIPAQPFQRLITSKGN